MTAFADRFIFILADATIKATIFLALAAIIAVLSRRASASFRHLIWALGLGCALGLPLLSQALPPWRVVLPIPTAHARPVAVSEPLAEKPQSTLSGNLFPVAPTAASPKPPATAPVVVPAVQYAPSHAIRRGAAKLSWTTWVILIWAVGAGIVLTRLVRGLMLLQTVARNCHSNEHAPAMAAMDAARRAMGVNHLVRLRQAKIGVPITWGARRPIVVLPAEATQWPQERLNAVLLHEIAHVRRQDWALQVAAQFTCALYWFHPLVWLGARRMRAESETACDVSVLAAGIPAADYARHLLDVALSARIFRRPVAGAVAMVQSPEVERRLRAVLAMTVSRRPITRPWIMRISAMAFLLALSVGVLRLETQASLIAEAHADQMAGHFSHALALLQTPHPAATPAENRGLQFAVADVQYAWAQSLLTSGEDQQSLPHFQAALVIDRTTRPAQSARDLVGEGKVYQLRGGDQEKAISLFRQALVFFQKIGDKNGEATAIQDIGRTYFYLSESHKAVPFYQHALRLYQQVGNKQEQVSTLAALGDAYSYLGQTSEGISLYQQALFLSQQVGDKNGEARLLDTMGYAYFSLRQYRKAVTFYQEALIRYQEVSNREREGTVLQKTGDAYLDLGQFRSAITCYQQSLTIYQKFGDRYFGAWPHLFTGIGYAYDGLGEYGQALSSYQQALHQGQGPVDEYTESRALMGMGDNYRHLSQYRESINCYQKALPLYQQIGDKDGEAKTLMDLGHVYFSLSQYSKSYSLYQRSLSLYQQIGDKDGKTSIRVDMDRTYKHLKIP